MKIVLHLNIYFNLIIMFEVFLFDFKKENIILYK